MRGVLLILGVIAFGGCALSQQGIADVEPPAPDAIEQKENETPENGGGKNEESQPTVSPQQSRPQPSPWTVFTIMRNGYGSNVDFDVESVGSYGAVLATGVGYDGDDFDIHYEIAGHQYTNTDKWDRVSQLISASFEQSLPGNWNFELEGNVGFKGSSEDRDIVDQDLEISPRLEYQFTSARRLRFFTRHRLKRYNDDPLSNAFKNYVGAEYLTRMGPNHFVELGARFETNDERNDRSDSRRWTYYAAHGIPLTDRDALVAQVRYRLKRYTQRFVEVEDEDVLRQEHRWTPSISWVRTLNDRINMSIEYAYETTYSNDPEKEYNAHMFWTSVGYRWK